jgi:hypothetical protein
MSTKLEDLSDNEEEQMYEEEEYEESEEEFVEKPMKKKKRDVVENFEEGSDMYSRVLKMLIEKLKNPVLVTLIMLVLTNPLLIQGIFRLPYVEVIDGTISINVILSILAGIIFFILTELF